VSTRKSASQPKDSPNSDALTEWQEARDVLARFDGNLHDLRKYGFSFVTGLLTVDALFATISDYFRLAALIGTMALIVVLALVDRNYRVFEEGATQRATLLENRSSSELTKTIVRTYDQERVGTAFKWVYRGLAVVTFMLGVLVLGLSPVPQLLNGVALVAAIILLVRIEERLELRPWVYFEVDGFKYKKPSEVLVVVTHLSNYKLPPITLRDAVCAVYNENGTRVKGKAFECVLKKPIQIPPGGDYRWTFPTKHIDSGLYRVVYYGPLYPDFERVDATAPVPPARWNWAPRLWVIE
jgi:hypothetical protein